MKKQGYFIYLIVIFGVILRTAFLNKTEGLWNDEYVSYMIAAKPFFKEFWTGVISQCHMPLYYLYLKLTMWLFGDNDIVLRSSSVFAGMLSIIVMYYTGKTRDVKIGLITALFTAISSFLIYYSQEVRLYSILFLFSALSLLTTIKLLQEQNRKNITFYIITNLLVVFTHTIGFVYAGLNLLFVSIMLFDNHRKNIIKLWSITGIGILLACPLILKIFMTQSFSQWWDNFTISKFGFLLTDYFSPVLTNLISSPDIFFYDKSLKFIICALLPALIALIWIVKSVKSKFEAGLLSICAGIVLVMTAAALAGRLVFTTKYSIEIYPILLFLAASGALSINNKILKNSLIIVFCLINTGYIIFNPTSAPKIRRAEGNKIVADMLYRANIQKGDTILLTYYDNSRFEKYFDFSDYNVVSINKGNFNYYLTPDTAYYDAYKNGKQLYKDVFTDYNNKYFESKINDDVLKKLKKGQSLYFISLDSVSAMTPEQVASIVNNNKLYENTPLLFLVFSYIKSEGFNILAKQLQIAHFEVKGNWRLIKLTKLNNP